MAGAGAAVSGDKGLYERDFVLWAEAQAAGLREAAQARINLPLDWINLAEELESLGRSQRRELKSRIANLTEHLLKLELSSASQPRAGWMETVGRERREIQLLVEDSPSLRSEVAAMALAVWPRTAKLVRQVLVERGEMSLREFPEDGKAGYTVDQLLGDWLPDRVSPAPAPEGASRGSP